MSETLYTVVATFDPVHRTLYLNDDNRQSRILLRNVSVGFSQDRRTMFLDGEHPTYRIALTGLRLSKKYESDFLPDEPKPVKWQIEKPGFFARLMGIGERKYVSGIYETWKRERYSVEVQNFMIVY